MAKRCRRFVNALPIHPQIVVKIQNWRGRPLTSHQTIVELISHATTDAALVVPAAIDENEYETGIKISDEELAQVKLTRSGFHGE